MATNQVDVYFIGRLKGVTGFTEGSFCKYSFVHGQQWTVIDGMKEGQTQIDTPDEGNTNVWSHPLDIHFETSGIQGWPKISLEVWEHDSLGRSFLAGYGVCDLPMNPGSFELKVPLWRPVGSLTEELTADYIGGAPQLVNQDLVNKPDHRSELKTESAGVVNIDISLILGRAANFQVSLN